MKTVVTITMLCLSSALWSQEIIENGEKPSSPDAGRVVKIEKVFAVPETGNDYVLQNRRKLTITEEGHFFILDQTSVLEFDASMNHIRTYSPEGEQIMLHSMQISKEKIHVYSRMYPPCLYSFTRANHNVNMFVASDRMPFYLFEYLNRHYFLESNMYSVNKEGKDHKEKTDLDVKSKESMEGDTRTVVTFDPQAAFDPESGLAYVSNTPEYLINQIDLKTGKILRKFNRKYERVQTHPSQARWSKYKLDMMNILCVDDKIWVITSTVDEKKGQLVDVFNQSGKYLDSFWINCREKGQALRFSAKNIAVYGDHLYILYLDTKNRAMIGKGEIFD